MPQVSVLGQLLFLLQISELFSILENKLIGYADDSTLMPVVPSPGVKVTVAESLIRNIGRVIEWCDLWGMKLNASKTKTMIVSRSRTIHLQSPPLTIGWTVLKNSDDIVILGVTLIPRWPLRSIFARFPEMILKDLVSRSSPGESTMIDRNYWEMHLRFLSCQFWSTVVLSCRYKSQILGQCSQWRPVSNWGCVWLCHWSSSICGSTMYAV